MEDLRVLEEIAEDAILSGLPGLTIEELGFVWAELTQPMGVPRIGARLDCCAGQVRQAVHEVTEAL